MRIYKKKKKGADWTKPVWQREARRCRDSCPCRRDRRRRIRWVRPSAIEWEARCLWITEGEWETGLGIWRETLPSICEGKSRSFPLDSLLCLPLLRGSWKPTICEPNRRCLASSSSFRYLKSLSSLIGLWDVYGKVFLGFGGEEKKEGEKKKFIWIRGRGKEGLVF